MTSQCPGRQGDGQWSLSPVPAGPAPKVPRTCPPHQGPPVGRAHPPYHMDSMSSLTIDDLRSRVGQELGTSEPFPITQDRVNLFADATEDHQWIHVDVE